MFWVRCVPVCVVGGWDKTDEGSMAQSFTRYAAGEIVPGACDACDE